ncbi:hypothetical protein KSP39_PZI017405 [Platanthera zijinensis]|uniref:BZIP transcription factor n=1 Tax=Platanthera zijinensis TaxID=2320716 RepID=A0AAP0G055_9ASPA
MGCASSKADDLPLVTLCRERRELLRAAAGHRYVLAAAHASYFRALDRVGDALHRFVAEELVTGPASLILTLPPSEGKPSKSKSSGSNTAKGDNASDAIASSPPSPLSSSVSPFSGSHVDDECHHLHQPLGSDLEESFRSPNNEGGAGQGWNSFSHSVSFQSFPNSDYYYMKAAPTMASTVYHHPHVEQWSNAQEERFGYGFGYGYGYPSFTQDDAYSYEPPGASGGNEAPIAPPSEEQRSPPQTPPPPPPQESSWDFFNPFDSYEQIFDRYAKSSFRLGSVASSPNSSEVREQEGIPDLEEETEHEYVEEKGKQSISEEKRAVDDDSDRLNSSVGSSEAVAMPNVKDKGGVLPEEQEDKKRRLDGGNPRKSGEVKECRNKRPHLEATNTPVIMEDNRQKKDVALPVQRTKDVVEAVREITEQFKSAACCGEDVSRILEVGKMQYRPRIRIFRGASILKMSEAACTDFEKYISLKSSNLSSTLEQLYMWEKKLYKEVKDEEKLRLFYDREYTRLKDLDGRGAESGKIDATRVTINKLTTKISITIKSVYAISRRIHKLRDEELRPQLVELIHGLIRMWSSMLDCHQRQFQAIFEASSQKFLFKSIPPQSLPTKATSELEIELMNWCTCFSNWIRAQKAYIESLNGWLMKWLLHEKEDTPNGITPFSPSRIGAPAIFIVSNDWRHIIEKTSEDEVLAAMHSFAANLHRLCESKNEEQRQKLKAEYLSKDFERRLKALQKQKMENEHPYEPHNKITVSAPDNNIPDLNGGMVDLDLMQKHLDEEKAKHVNAMKQIHEVASCSLKTGLIPIFEALEDYSSETLKLYYELRLPESNSL